jgi:hypothetical protein
MIPRPRSYRSWTFYALLYLSQPHLFPTPGEVRGIFKT